MSRISVDEVTDSSGAGAPDFVNGIKIDGITFTVNIPPSTNTTVISSDRGKYLNISSNVTINSSTGFASGDTVSVYNASTSNITIIATGITLRFAGTATTGNRTLAQKGIATVLCVGSNDYVISGAGLS
jgi:hypothetical protein